MFKISNSLKIYNYIQNKLTEIKNELMRVSTMHFKLNSFQGLVLYYYDIQY